MLRCKCDGQVAKIAKGPLRVIKFTTVWHYKRNGLPFNDIDRTIFWRLRLNCPQQRCWETRIQKTKICSPLVTATRKSQKPVSYWWWTHRWAVPIRPRCTGQKLPLSTPSKTSAHRGHKNSLNQPPPAGNTEKHHVATDKPTAMPLKQRTR